MKWMIFDVFHKSDEDLTNATTEDAMMKASSLSNYKTAKLANGDSDLARKGEKGE
jgi:hypothetical protein